MPQSTISGISAEFLSFASKEVMGNPLKAQAFLQPRNVKIAAATLFIAGVIISYCFQRQAEASSNFSNQRTSHPSGLRAQLRSAGNFVRKVANHMTWGQLYSKQNLNDSVQALDIEEWEKSALLPNVQTLNKITYLGSGAIEAWSNMLIGRFKHLTTAANSTHQITAIELPELEDGKELYAIPVVVRGEGLVKVDHIVTFMYHKPSHTVIFYDSKGKSLQDYKNSALSKHSETIKLIDVYRDIMNTYAKDDESGQKQAPNFWYNDTLHQYDAFNCGVYVMDWIQRCTELLPTESSVFDEVKQILDDNKAKPLTTHEATYTRRVKALKDLLPALENKTPSVPSKTSIIERVARSAFSCIMTAAEAVSLENILRFKASSL